MHVFALWRSIYAGQNLARSFIEMGIKNVEWGQSEKTDIFLQTQQLLKK